MKSRVFGMLVASVGALSLGLVSSEAFAGSPRAAFASTHFTSHRIGTRAFRHHVRPGTAFVWGDDGLYGYGLPLPETVMEGAPPLTGTTGGVHYPTAYDIPWDWAHRYPPAVASTGRPYVSSCGSETVTVPNGHGGTGQVNIVRCY